MTLRMTSVLPGDEMSDYRRSILGGDARLHFPIRGAAHKGGSQMLKTWSRELRSLANAIDNLTISPLEEYQMLFSAKMAVWNANQKINAYRRVTGPKD